MTNLAMLLCSVFLWKSLMRERWGIPKKVICSAENSPLPKDVISGAYPALVAPTSHAKTECSDELERGGEG